MNVSITVNTTDLTDIDLKQLSQLGVDYVDFGNGASFKGVKEQGHPDIDALLKLRKRIQSWGLDINRVTLPNITKTFMEDNENNEIEVENSLQAIRVFGEAGIKIVRQRFAGDTYAGVTKDYSALQRGGAYSRGESLHFNKNPEITRTVEEHNAWWESFSKAYQKLVLKSLDHDMKLAMHPSDSPIPGTPFDSVGYHRIIDQFPNKNVGYIYCVGTRAEAGGTPLVLDEINHYGRKNRIFLVHFRNVKGTFPTAGAFEEALLDDGDMNMFKILLELRKVGFNGCLNPDHVPLMEGDNPDLNSNWSNSNIGWTASSIGFAYSIGYIKAMLAALTEFEGR
ncbi:mannonate dehydratase [Geomicrobium halophilum]|uniref:mannonate dehydratase n=1 Tax=Geomicrobium halophilum TaxID=549000 RepID=A0A841Q070_9BACL|nr:mannonate dehydratase [Geomicrobium halophilum]MBB6448668.1 mannonate dehydratase [Geomicrobium halophilum]